MFVYVSLIPSLLRAGLTQCWYTLHTHTHTPQGFQLQLSSLEQNRRELQETLQVNHPETASYQRQRQQMRDGIVGLAASLAGLRSSLNSNAENHSRQQAQLTKQSKTLEVSVVCVCVCVVCVSVWVCEMCAVCVCVWGLCVWVCMCDCGVWVWRDEHSLVCSFDKFVLCLPTIYLCRYLCCMY